MGTQVPELTVVQNQYALNIVVTDDPVKSACEIPPAKSVNTTREPVFTGSPIAYIIS